MKATHPSAERRIAARVLLQGSARKATVVTTLLMTAAASGAAGNGAATAFQKQIRSAMDLMMSGMDAAPTGDVDRDFVAAMEPHHRAAIDMALAELRYGRNEQLRRISQEIIIDQQQEIAAMRMAIGKTVPPSAPAPTTESPSGTGPQHEHHGASHE